VRIEKFDGNGLPVSEEVVSTLNRAKVNQHGAVRMGVVRLAVFNIMNEKITVDLMQALSNMYEKSYAANKMYLIRRLVNLKMGEGNSVTNHISKFNTIIARLTSVQITFDDEVKALILFSSLLKSWSATITTVSNSASNSKLKLDNIRDLMLSEDVHRKNSGESSSSSSGSGASFHTTPSLELLSNYVSGKFGKVYLTDGKSLDIIGRCNINIRTSNGNVWTLNNVRYIPALRRNLIYIKQLDDEGHCTTFRDGHWKVMRGNFVVARGKKQ